jgi:agmatinase
LRDEYLGVSLSHACVIRRCHDLLGDNKIWQFGIRSGDRPEFQWAAEGHTNLHKFDFDGLDEALADVQGHPVYFTLDLDVLDPSYFPGTGTPEAGGVTFLALLKAAIKVCSKAHVIACDVNELAPNYDQSGVSTAIAGKIVREMLLAL